MYKVRDIKAIRCVLFMLITLNKLIINTARNNIKNCKKLKPHHYYWYIKKHLLYCWINMYKRVRNSNYTLFYLHTNKPELPDCWIFWKYYTNILFFKHIALKQEPMQFVTAYLIFFYSFNNIPVFYNYIYLVNNVKLKYDWTYFIFFNWYYYFRPIKYKNSYFLIT